MFHRRPFLLLLTSIRFANLPSVVSNVWLGVALGVLYFDPELPPHLWLTAGLLTLAGLALYVSGNFLNDWYDRDWDARHRPERALPQGAFSSKLYLMLGIFFSAIGVALAGTVGLPSGVVAGLIVLCILGYTRWHKTAEWTVILMGLCRGLLPCLFLSHWWAAGPEWGTQGIGVIGIAVVCLGCQSLGLVLYVAALSQTARRESATSPRDPLRFPLVLFILAGCSMAVTMLVLDAPRDAIPHPLSGLLIFAIWILLCFTKFRQPIVARVSALLAGLPLLDWVTLLPLSLWVLVNRSAAPLEVRVAAVSLVLPPLAFLAGRLLQRLTPAT